VDEKFHKSDVIDCGIYKEVMGSDHCPVYIQLKGQPKLEIEQIPTLSSRHLLNKVRRRRRFWVRDSMKQNNKQDKMVMELLHSKRSSEEVRKEEVESETGTVATLKEEKRKTKRSKIDK
jgi:hypothetical protein